MAEQLHHLLEPHEIFFQTLPLFVRDFLYFLFCDVLYQKFCLIFHHFKLHGAILVCLNVMLQGMPKAVSQNREHALVCELYLI